MAKKKTKKPLSKKQLKRRKRKRLLIAEAVVLVILLLVLVLWLWLGKIDFKNLKNIGKNRLDADTQSLLDGYTCIALFGVDNRASGNYSDGRSDSIIIACIDNDTKQVRLCSVYRDTFLEIDDGNYNKCNSAFSKDGAKGAIEMLNKNLDLDIQEYIAVDFNALVDVVDALGGIEITLTGEEATIMNQSYINETAKSAGKAANPVSAGTHTLDGVQAVSYCRIRYTSGDDFKRTSRQREVLTKISEKAKGMSTSTAVSMAGDIMDEVETSLSMSQITKLASYMKDYELVETTGFPFDRCTGTYKATGASKGQSMVIPCTLESNVTKLHAYFFGQENYKPTKEVREASDYIKKYTGKTESSALDYAEYDY